MKNEPDNTQIPYTFNIWMGLQIVLSNKQLWIMEIIVSSVKIKVVMHKL